VPRVVVTRSLPEPALRALRDSGANVWVSPEDRALSAEELRDAVRGAEAIVAMLHDRVDDALLGAAGEQLRVVANVAVGYDNVDLDAARRHGVTITNTPGVLTDATADMAFCLLIGAARRLVEGDAYSRSGRWKTWEPLGHLGQDLVGRTLGVVGMGRIGYALARRCKGWDMRVLYHDVYPSAAAEKDLGATRVDLDTLLTESDFVSVHTDLNEATRGLFNLARFRQMKRTAVFVNTARGPVMVQKDLVQALREGLIFAAGLDVTDPEPPDPSDPLLQLPNVVVAPHIASATVGTRNAMADICARNLIAGVSGQDLPAWVNKEVAPRRRR
jgi:glyoxylate reductase